MQTIAQQLMEKGKLEGMQLGMQQGMQHGMQKGLQKGMQKEKMEVVKKAIRAGLSIETIAMISGLSIDEIRQMQSKMKLKIGRDH